MLKEFKNFILTGNVIDFAIAVILAGAVGAVVNGFVSDIMMPAVGHFSGGIDFADKFYELDKAVPAVMDGDKVITKEKPMNAIMYGKWINTIISLIVVGFVLFMMSKAATKAMKKKEEEPAPPPVNEVLLGEIRDLLKK